MSDLSLNSYELDKPIRVFVKKILIGIDENHTVQEAAKKMGEFKISSLVVLKDDKIIGFFTDGDIRKKVVAEGLGPDTLVKEVMTKELIKAKISISIKDAFDIMSKNNVKHILVTDKNEIVGILTFRDLIDIERHKLETHISRE